MKVVPWPGVLSTSMRPPCCSMMPWVMARPKPVPLSLVVKKGSNIFSWTSLGIPHPESEMTTRISLRRGSQRVAHLDGAAGGGGFDGVDEQIDKGLLKLIAGRPARRAARRSATA